MPWKRGAFHYDITYGTAKTVTKSESDYRFTTYTPLVRIWKTINRVITAPHCILKFKNTRGVCEMCDKEMSLILSWWRHQMETFSALLALCGEFTGPGEFPTQRPVTRSFDVFFHLRLNKRLSKQPRGWWFETPTWSLWRQCNGSQFVPADVTVNTKLLPSQHTT